MAGGKRKKKIRNILWGEKLDLLSENTSAFTKRGDVKEQRWAGTGPQGGTNAPGES